MTNTGDFRRYSYNADAANAIRYFDNRRSSAAPAYTPEPKKDFRVRTGSKKKSIAQLRQEEKVSVRTIALVCTVAALCLAMFFGVLYTHAQKNELVHEISALESDYSVAKSENTRLNSELDSLVSMSMIDQYAVERLGMSKMKSTQIKYIDVSQYKQKRLAAAQALLNQDGAKSKAAKSAQEKTEKTKATQK